jgi:4-nitrophenyl phosphatase
LGHIAAVILAAGGSTRFGQPKQLLDWGGSPLLGHIVNIAISAALSPVIVVLGSGAERLRPILDALPVQTVMNWGWEEGMSTSVRAGLAVLPPGVEAAVFLQCDQPLITPELLKAIVACYKERGTDIVHPTYASERATPVLFGCRHFPELAAVLGDEGGRGLIDRHSERVATIEVADGITLADIDTPADYERLRVHALPSQFQASRTQHPSSILRSITHLIIDMDGVLWRGDEPIPGLQEFFAFLRGRHIGFVLATNNSSKTPEEYVRKLARFGVEITSDSVLTSSQATAAHLSTVAPPGTRVYAIGKAGVRQALEEHHFILTNTEEEANGQEAQYVVVGWDQDLSWRELATASLLIHNGAGFIGTNPDNTFPTERGPVPGNGAQLAALQAATGVPPLVLGKPEPGMFEEAMRRMGARPETTAIVGDRLNTDIAGGIRAGITTILVLSGIASQDSLAASPVRPTLVYADITELVHAWPSPSTQKQSGISRDKDPV